MYEETAMKVSEEPTREMDRVVERLNIETDHLVDLVAEIERRLRNITLDEPPSDGSPIDVAPPRMGTPLAATIDTYADRVLSSTGRLRSLLDRLQI